MIDYEQEARDALFNYVVDITRQVQVCEKKARGLQEPGYCVSPTALPLTIDANGNVVEDLAYWQTAWANIRETQVKFARGYAYLFGGGKDAPCIIDLAKDRIREEANENNKLGGNDNG